MSFASYWRGSLALRLTWLLQVAVILALAWIVHLVKQPLPSLSVWDFQDPELVDYLVNHKIPLELCPMSNVRTGAVSTITEHPIKNYFKQGLIISVNTDDPKMFGTSLNKEYELLEQKCGFTRQEICKLILLAIESSWLPGDRKKSLAASFKKEPSWVG